MSSFSTIIHITFSYYNIFCKIVAHVHFSALQKFFWRTIFYKLSSVQEKNTIRHFAKPISCVTIAIVIPVVTNDFITSNTSFTISGSSADVGSSNNITSGSIANALAIATRCFCPPERRFGYVSFYLLIQPFLKVSQLSFQLLASLPLLH